MPTRVRPFPLLLAASFLFVAASARAEPSATILVHIDSPSPVTLARQEHGEWQAVCESPCDDDVPRAGRYRIEGGKGEAPSSELVLDPTGDRVVLTVRPGSKAARERGVALAAVGGVTMAVGILTLLAGAVQAAGPCSNVGPNANEQQICNDYYASDRSDAERLEAIGGGIAVLGLVGLVLGIAEISNGKTSVRGREVSTVPVASKGGAGLAISF